MATAESTPEAAKKVHPHAIRWNAEQQLWICTINCGFSRPKRAGEIVPTREEALQEARRAGTGADFLDLKPRAPVPGQGPGSAEKPRAAAPIDQ
jgi:hypothetical protein